MSKAQRILYIVVFAGLGLMLAMWYFNKQTPPDRQPASTGPVTTEPTTRLAPLQVAAEPTTETPPPTRPATEPTTRRAPPPVEAAAIGSRPVGPATEPATSTTDTATKGAEPEAARWTFVAQPAEQVLLGSLDPRTGYRMQVKVVTPGSAVETVKLSEYFDTVEDKRRFDKDPEAFALEGHYSLMNPIGAGADETLALTTRRIALPDEGIRLDLSGAIWKIDDVQRDAAGNARAVTLTAQINRNDQPFLRVEKTYSLTDPADYAELRDVQRRVEGYSLRVSVRAVNLSARKVNVALTQFAGAGVRREDFRSDGRALTIGRYDDKELKVAKVAIKDLHKHAVGLASAKVLGSSTAADAVLWVGEGNKYFAAATYVLPEGTDQTLSAPAAQASFSYAAVAESGASRTFLPVLELGNFEIAAGGSAGAAMDVFAGPKRRDLLGDNALYKKLSYIDLLDLKSCFCAFSALALMMMWLLDLFSKVLFGNYGLAIVLLVVLVRLVLHPVTKRSQVSMLKMQKFQPQIEALKEKYKGDKDRLNKEMAGFYKQHGATPILGCLPMLLQMPIWIALWTGIQATVELRHAAFLPVWITDLAAPDKLIGFGGWSFKIPWLSDAMAIGPIVSFNLLPILLAVAMALQQKYTPSSSSTAGTGQQAKTQKQMMGFMTVFFLLIFYNAPSGLTMYIMASTFAGVAEQIVIRRHIKEKEAVEAASETQVAMPGGHFRGQKPKKAKPPFRIK